MMNENMHVCVHYVIFRFTCMCIDLVNASLADTILLCSRDQHRTARIRCCDRTVALATEHRYTTEPASPAAALTSDVPRASRRRRTAVAAVAAAAATFTLAIQPLA